MGGSQGRIQDIGWGGVQSQRPTTVSSPGTQGRGAGDRGNKVWRVVWQGFMTQIIGYGRVEPEGAAERGCGGGGGVFLTLESFSNFTDKSTMSY